MEFWNWFQIVAAVVVGNAFTASIAFFLLYIYRHQEIQKRDEASIPLWVYPFFLVPMAAVIGAYVSLS